MLIAFALLAGVAGPAEPCGHSRPVAGDLAAARRIALATIRAHPASRPVIDAAAAGRPYRLVVEVDDEDARQWSAFQLPPGPGAHMGGGGLEFRIDRCTGAISRMHHSR
jgi:hypothetical protein